MNSHQEKVAFFLPSLEGGGAERVVVNLIKEFVKREIKVELVLASAKGPYLSELPKEVRIIDLKSPRVIFSIPKLISYLREEKLDIFISSLSHANLVSIISKKIARSKTKLFLREDNTLSLVFYNSKSFKTKVIPFLVKLLYSHADLVIAVSDGVKDDLVGFAKLSPDKIKVIYNPVITPELFQKAREPVSHPWFAPNSPPVILGVGRLTKQKDFPTLLKAFALVRKENDSRLVILGEGEERKNLEKLAKELGIEEFLWMPGFVDNPYKYMSKASVFVLSSIYEGLPTVLIEALALGCKVVSTDCKSGPREILDDGKSGKLVPVGDFIAMKEAIVSSISVDRKSFYESSLNEQIGKFELRNVANLYLRVLGLIGESHDWQ
jgi:glycosyltransferase involved in cell wall biosynthesis